MTYLLAESELKEVRRVYILGNIHFKSEVNVRRFNHFKEGLYKKKKIVSKMTSEEMEVDAFLDDYG